MRTKERASAASDLHNYPDHGLSAFFYGYDRGEVRKRLRRIDNPGHPLLLWMHRFTLLSIRHGAIVPLDYMPSRSMLSDECLVISIVCVCVVVPTGR